MIVDKEVIIMECSDTLPHEAHSWRTGFLWIHKNTCQGVTAKQFEQYMEMKYPTPKPPHKHKFQYRQSQKHLWVNPDRYVWVCKDQKCDVIISSDKEEFRGALLYKGRSVARRLPPRRKSWRSN